jgi:outer membrane protein
MNKTAITLCLLVTTLLFSASAIAQQQITIEDAIQIALDQSINIQQAQNNLQRNQADIRSARGAFLPNLNASSSLNRSTGQQFNQSTLQLETFTQYSMSGNITSNVPLFTGWQNISNLRRAGIDRDAAENDFERLKEETIFQTVTEFLQVILNQELLEIAKDNLSVSLKQLEQVEAQVEVGMRPIVDLFNQEAVVANNEFQVIQRENALNISKLRAIRILQLNPVDDYEFVAPEVDETQLSPQAYSLPELIETALLSRRDLQSQELRIRSAEQSLRIARSGYLPTLSFGASLSSSYNDAYRFLGETRSFSDQFLDERVNYGFGLSLSIPIFDRFQTRSNMENRRIDIKNATLALQDQKSLVYQEVLQAYNDYISIVQELRSTEAAFVAAEKAFETQQERYNVGSATLIELTTANNEFVNAASNRIQTVYRFIFQEKVLDFFLGRITEDITL